MPTVHRADTPTTPPSGASTQPPPPPWPPAPGATPPPPSPPPAPPVTARRPARDAGSRAAAWITGTGAFLLVAAAAVFVWVQWSRLPLEAKIAIIGGVTGAVLLAGARLRPRLPIAGSALLHLGAFLLPVDLAALTNRLEVDWPEAAVAEGVLILVAFPLIARIGQARLLRWASLGGAVLLATGLGGLTGVAAPVSLAVAAVVVAVVSGLRPTAEPYAAGLAVLAALGPIAALVFGEVSRRLEVVTTSGWAGDTTTVLALTPGLLAAGVLALEGSRRRSALTIHLAIVAPLTAVAGLLLRTDPSRTAVLVQAPALLVLLESLALAGRRDPLWREATARLALGAEVLTLAVLPAALTIVLVPTAAERAPSGVAGEFGIDLPAATAWAVTAVGAAIATVRRSLGRGTTHLAGVLATGILTAAAVAHGTGDAVLVALVLAATGLLAAATGDALASVAGATIALGAVATVTAHPTGGLVVAALAVATGLVPVLRGIRVGRPGDVQAAVGGLAAVIALGLVTLLPEPHLLPDPVMAAVFAAVCVGLAVAVGRDRVVADLARGAVLAVSVAVLPWRPEDAILPLAVAALLLVAETVRTGRPGLAPLAAVPVHHVVVEVGLASGWSWAEIGLGLVAAGAVWAALSLLVDDRWQQPLLAVAVSAGAVGWALSGSEQRAFGVATLVVGAVVLTAGLVGRHTIVGHVGGGLLSLGTWVLLDDASVELIELYVAPVAAHLLGAGLVARKRDPQLSSWIAYAPPILVLAVPALAERLGGAGGGHALVVGAVGVAAVVAGAFRRLGAPLVLGVLLLVSLTLYEALAVVASVPTWAWLALGGATLLGAGIALERSGTSPVAAGRKLVGGFTDRFA